MATTPHNFLHEPHFLPVFCDHDGKVIRPLRAWKCSGRYISSIFLSINFFFEECKMVVHSKCKSKVAHFCGTRQIAVQMYEEWKEQVKKIFFFSF